MIIKAISLWEPWATAWVIGLKKGETRGWCPRAGAEVYRGPLAVQAAKTKRDPKARVSLRDVFRKRLMDCRRSAMAFSSASIYGWDDLRPGHVIGICWLDSVVPSEKCTPDQLERSWGDFGRGRFIWVPQRMTRLPVPVPCVGRQTLFNWEIPDSVLSLPEVQRVLEFGAAPTPAADLHHQLA